MTPPTSDVPGTSIPGPRPVDDEPVETGLDDLRRDLRVERALLWKEAFALLVAAVVAIAYFLWAS